MKRWSDLPRSLVAALLLLGMAGCNRVSPFDYIPVQGMVRYEDGSRLPGGCTLVFESLDVSPVGDAHPRPGKALVDKNGRFSEVTSHKYADGLVAGRHKVVFLTNDTTFVPVEYTSSTTTPLTVDTADIPLEIRIPKPNKHR